MKIWIIIKAILIIGLVTATAASRLSNDHYVAPAPVFVYLLMAAISCVIYIPITQLILRLFSSTKKHIECSIWHLTLFIPLSFAHLLAWLAFAFSAGLVLQCFMGQPVTDDVLIPLAGSLGTGIGILISISILKQRN